MAPLPIFPIRIGPSPVRLLQDKAWPPAATLRDFAYFLPVLYLVRRTIPFFVYPRLIHTPSPASSLSGMCRITRCDPGGFPSQILRLNSKMMGGARCSPNVEWRSQPEGDDYAQNEGAFLAGGGKAANCQDPSDTGGDLAACLPYLPGAQRRSGK